MKYQPYTYLIGWSKKNKYYYGVRYGKNCNPKDLWKTYFTSSKRVKKFIEENGNPDIIQIRKVFDDKQSARSWEFKFIRKANLIKNKNFLNCHDGGESFLNKGNYNLPKRSKEHSLKISNSRKGKKWSLEQKRKRSVQYTGSGNPRYGKKLSKEQKIEFLKKRNQYKPFIIDKKYYNFLEEAEEDYNISRRTVRDRLSSDNLKWDNWRYIDDNRKYKEYKHGNSGRKRPDLSEYNKTSHPRIKKWP